MVLMRRNVFLEKNEKCFRKQRQMLFGLCSHLISELHICTGALRRGPSGTFKIAYFYWCTERGPSRTFKLHISTGGMRVRLSGILKSHISTGILRGDRLELLNRIFLPVH